MKLRTFWYFSRQATRALARNTLMSLAAMTTITIALLFFGGFYIIASNVNNLGQLAKGKIEIRAFLSKEGVRAEEMERRLLSLAGVKSVKFVSKEEGAKILNRLLGQGDLFSEENPLPDSFNIYPMDGADVEEIARQVQKLPGINEVVYGQNFVKFLNLLVRLIWVVGLTLFLLTVLAVLYIVINTIQLTVYARRKEIEIMKLVGATDWFVRWPFLLEGVYLGIAGAFISVIILLEGYSILYGHSAGLASFLPLLTRGEIIPKLIASLFAMGILFGALGSLLSVKRYLKV